MRPTGTIIHYVMGLSSHPYSHKRADRANLLPKSTKIGLKKKFKSWPTPPTSGHRINSQCPPWCRQNPLHNYSWISFLCNNLIVVFLVYVTNIAACHAAVSCDNQRKPWELSLRSKRVPYRLSSFLSWSLSLLSVEKTAFPISLLSNQSSTQFGFRIRLTKGGIWWALSPLSHLFRISAIPFCRCFFFSEQCCRIVDHMFTLFYLIFVLLSLILVTCSCLKKTLGKHAERLKTSVLVHRPVRAYAPASCQGLEIGPARPAPFPLGFPS